ncbi:shK domain-like domain-containing protein [Ditylenchus destructor]|uniref:ShK domain-like domain-containing protein n=1 Tax=Ditylenchus destructor TaxID=166010 RepID=A0AAD4NBE1_9BILA|nr:shK domain-like domain-containing protein [Ditylenchus destructor]
MELVITWLAISFLRSVHSMFYCLPVTPPPANSPPPTCPAGQIYFASIQSCCGMHSTGDSEEQMFENIPGPGEPGSIPPNCRSAPQNFGGGVNPGGTGDKPCVVNGQTLYCRDQLQLPNGSTVPGFCAPPRTIRSECSNRCCGTTPFTSPDAGAATGATTGIGSTAFCVDKSVPGRASDCPAQKALCDQPLYRDLMTDQCPRTCNRCGVVSPLRGNLNGLQQNPNVFGLGGTVPATQGCLDGINARGFSECPQNKAKCNSRIYGRFMAVECCFTCRGVPTTTPVPLLGPSPSTLVIPPGLQVPGGTGRRRRK